MKSLNTSDKPVIATAYLTALYRAIESERRDALFHDPYARLLAGKKGEQIEETWPHVQQEVGMNAVRTKIYDTMILNLIRKHQIDTVISLGAGLDSRPYRLDLPAELRWIEVDFARLQAYKQKKLADVEPACRLEYVSLDICNTASRQEFLARVGRDSQHAIVLTEGLISYLAPKQVSAITQELHEHASFRWWITDYLPAYMTVGGEERLRSVPSLNGEFFQFVPADGVRFFEKQGWVLRKHHAQLTSLRKMKRDVRLGWVLRLLSWLSYITSDDRKSYRHTGGFVLFENKAALPEETEKKQKGKKGQASSVIRSIIKKILT